ncbi:MAG TPA: hypothetical protein VFX16_05855 [Pseudonocardiaceae bacterium]|nr:hypothetical protein [Pseudonocardiaceae bacterium]
MAANPVPALSQDDVDRELNRLTTDGDRIADALVALEAHPGYSFLQGGTLTGGTDELWRTTRADIAVLYQQFGFYRSVLDKAREVRARRNRPGAAELAELTTLLRGSAVELATEEIPLGRRNLTGPTSITHRMTLAELVASMDRSYQRASDVVVAADDVWTAAVRLLDPLDERLDQARELSASLGLGEARHPLFTELDTIGGRLSTLRARAFADPLSLYTGEPGNGRPNLGEADDLTARLASVRTELDALATVRADLDQSLARAGTAIDAVVADEAAARAAYDVVLEKIASPAIASVPDGAPALRAELAGVTALVTGHDWPRVSAALTALAAATGAAADRARDVRDTADALLGRRAELRGRLDAYRVKAAQLRLAEDAEIAARYQEAYDLLWTVPCDLRAATRALNRYQQAIAARGPKP